jgi:hypothetical protein
MGILRKLFGVLGVLTGVSLVGWILFNLVRPTPGFAETDGHRFPLGPLAVGTAMILVGVKWLRS